MLPRELQVLSKVLHENIVRVVQIYQHPRGEFVLIIMAYASGGTMQDYIKRHGPYTESKAKTLFLGMANALDCMHNQEDPVAHRDLKLENILIDGNGTPKITDFSYTRYCKDESRGQNVLSETYCGTEPFLPLEVLVNRPYDPILADVWSLGVCLFYMLNGKKPFCGEGDAMVRAQRTRNYKYISLYDKKLYHKLRI